MKEYDPVFIKKMLDMPREECVAYLRSLPPQEREDLKGAMFRANSKLVAQELVANLNRNAVADQQKRDAAKRTA